MALGRTAVIFSMTCVALGVAPVSSWPAEAPGAPTIALLGTRIGATQAPDTVSGGTGGVVLLNVTVANEALALGGQTRTLTLLRLTNTTTGPGTLAQRDAELGLCRLHADNGNSVFDAGDVLLSTSPAASGKVTFDSLSFAVAPAQTRRLFAVTDVPLAVRDGDALDVSIQSASDVVVTSYGSFENTFPLNPAGSFLVDGMVAAQVLLGPVPGADVLAGAIDALFLNVVVPANGYAGDVLQQITLLQAGTAVPGIDFLGLRGFVDDGDGVFEPAVDRSLGFAGLTGGNRWQMTSLLEAVPPGGLRLFFSAEVPNSANDGTTLGFSIPAPPEIGLGMASANDGPLDAAVTGPSRRISTADRVTLSAPAIAPAVVRTDARHALVLHLQAQNRYGSAQVFNRLTVDNAGTGGATEDRDRAVQSLTLRADGNGDGVLGDSLTDPAIATSFFVAGRATFSGFTVSIPPGATWRGFVTARVAVAAATDGDTLSVRAMAPGDFGFADTTRVVATWPLDSRARAALDGMVAAQLGITPIAGATLAPSDSNMLALDVVIPRNGRLDDTLLGAQLVNLGTADPTDLAEVRLWRDGGDGAFSPATDLDLGAMAWNGTRWVSPPLSAPLGPAGLRLFAAVRLTAAARDSATIRLTIPVNGITVASGNDGPLDPAPPPPSALVVSNSPLLASIVVTPDASTAGQPAQVMMVVRNAGTVTLAGVTPSGLTATGTGSLTLTGGPLPASVDLAAGARDTLRWTAQAAAAGTVRLHGSAQGDESPGGTTRASLEATSNLHQVFAQAGALDVAIPSSLPATVARGQTGIAALAFQLTHPGSAGTAPLRVTALRIGLEDEAGGPLVPSGLLSRAAVMEGSTERLARTSLETSGSEVDLTLASPVIVNAGESAELTVTLDLLSSTVVTAFRVRVSDSTWVVARDAYGDAPVTARLTAGTWPVRSPVAQVVEPADHLDVASALTAPQSAGPGQDEVAMMTLRLTSPGVGGITSDVRVHALAVEIADTNGSALPLLSDVIEAIRVRGAFQTHVSRAVSWTDGGRLTLLLNPAVNVPVNTPVDLFVSVDLSPAAGAGALRLQVADSTRFDARDANTRNRVAPAFASDPLPGRVILLQSAAERLGVRGTPRLPASVRAGDTSVTAISIVLRHPGPADAAAIRVDSLVVTSRDEARRPVVPAAVLDNLRVTWNGTPAGSASDPPAFGETVALPLPGRSIAAGDSAQLELILDLAATAPEISFELSILAEGVRASDSNLGTRVAIEPDAGELPLYSGLTRVLAPSRTLVAALESRMPAVLAADDREVALARLTLTNPAGEGAGPITVDRLTLRAGDRSHAPRVLGALSSALTATAAGAPWASSSPGTGDTTVTLMGTAPVSIAPGGAAVFDLAFVPRSGVGSGTLRVGIDAAGVGVVQPSSALLQVQVQPQAGRTFPLWSEAGTFGALDLRASYSNFPNPFAAGREATSFAFFLASPARVWLTVYTLGGEAVRTLADGESRGTGIHQSDRWDGRNGVGRTVRNGVYVAELRVRYDGGSESRALRKVAVAR